MNYPASRGPSIFLEKSYLGRSKGLCSQGRNEQAWSSNDYSNSARHERELSGKKNPTSKVTAGARERRRREEERASRCLLRQ